MEKSCDQYKLEIQALADGELDKAESQDIFRHLSECSGCRDEYHEILTIKKRVASGYKVQPKAEWFEELEKKRSSKITRVSGYMLMLIPYLILATFGVMEFLKDSNETLLMKLAGAGIISGILILFGYTIRSRYLESKNDRYKEILR